MPKRQMMSIVAIIKAHGQAIPRFDTVQGAIFTTLRKDNSENRKKYMGNYIGGGQFEKQRPEFQIIIKEE